MASQMRTGLGHATTYSRKVRKNSRTSSTNNPGCSNAAKCPLSHFIPVLNVGELRLHPAAHWPQVVCSFAFLCWPEVHCDAVHAIAQASGLGAILKNVAEAAATMAAEHFDALHTEAAVGVFNHGTRNDGLVEQWPAGATFKFGVGVNKACAHAAQIKQPIRFSWFRGLL